MPSLPRNYQPVPSALEPRYVPQYGTLGDLLGLKARNTQQGWAQIASMFDRFVQTKRAEKAAEIERADLLAQRAAAEQLRRDEMAALAAERKADNDARQRQEARINAGDAIESSAPGPIDSLTAATIRAHPGTAGLVRSETTLPATPHIGEMAPPSAFDVREPTPKETASAQAVARAEKAAADAEAARKRDDDRQTARDREIARHNQALEAAARVRAVQDPEKPSVWVSKGSDMRFVTPSEAATLSRDGWRSGAGREQGRPVQTGDANRIADFDTSLDDLVTLAATLQDTQNATGVRAQIGAALPNPITNLTGWGRDPKIRQGVIDRVKQVIGKALEGGVLRKEDEIKYAKILPTIGDDPAVAASKLNGLHEAIIGRRQTLLDSLSDAGFDTSKFNARQPVSAVPDLAGMREGFSRTFRSGPFAGQEWAMVNGQPTRIK